MSTRAAGIRLAEITDAAEMARLAGELGYPMSSLEMARRLAALLIKEQHCVSVAARPGSVIGWIQVEHRYSLEGGERAEIMGLVVDSSARRLGLGRKLVDVAERWALGRGLRSLTIRSSVAREWSHPFYESLGYACIKTQHVYLKTIG